MLLSDVAPVPPLLATPEYFLGVVVDFAEVVPELLDGNNTMVFGPYGFGAAPDLTVTQIGLPASADGPFTVDVTVCNEGTQPVSGVDVTVYASTDNTIEPPPLVPWSLDVRVGQTVVSNLDPAACTVVTVPSSIVPGPSGAYFVGAIVDESRSVMELLESNNVTVEGPVGFGVGPDLVVRTFVVPPVLNGPAVTGMVEVCNDGTAVSSATDVVVVASQTRFPSLIPFFEPQLASESIPGLDPGQCTTLTPLLLHPFFISNPTQAFVSAVVDFNRSVPELVEVNNLRTEGPIGIGSGVELRVGAVSPPPFVTPGQEISVSVQVCNDGDIDVPSAEFRLLASADTILDTTGLDPMVGLGVTPLVPAGGCVNVTVSTAGFGFVAEGTWNIGAEVDPNRFIAELVEGNNTRLGSAVQVTPVFCGNGQVEPGEACDDGNFDSGDGCTSACVVEVCGDGIVNNGGTETCDDGNAIPYDGCSVTCQPQGALLGEVMQVDANQVGTAWDTAGAHEPACTAGGRRTRAVVRRWRPRPPAGAKRDRERLRVEDRGVGLSGW